MQNQTTFGINILLQNTMPKVYFPKTIKPYNPESEIICSERKLQQVAAYDLGWLQIHSMLANFAKCLLKTINSYNPNYQNGN